MKKFCQKCGVALERAEEEEQNLKIEERGKKLKYCLECAGWVFLAKLFEET